MSSPCTQVETITALKVTQQQMATDISDIKKGLKSLDDSIQSNHLLILSKFESLDLKYATKSSVNRLWTIVWSVIGFIALGVGGALFTKLLGW